ncbi:hypothetical protein R0L47_02795 [Pectobacterium polonicum]|uniref:hypothetical protein n=1 Tax=Pectobacterium polonicum TaxID=2485124 RepID=UPI0037546F10
MYNKIKNAVYNAIDNENSVDDYLLKKFKLDKNGIVFKPLRLKNINRLSNKLNTILYFIFPLYFIGLFLLHLLKRTVGGVLILPCVNHRFISFSNKSMIIYNKNKLQIPFVDLRGQNKILNKYLSCGELCKCFICSLIILFSCYGKTKIRNLPNLIHIYECSMFFIFLEKMKDNGTNRISHSNHYDRWATIISACDFFCITVYQHGLIDENYSPVIKIKNVDSIYTYDDKSEEYFCNKVLLLDSNNLIVKKRISISSFIIDDSEFFFALIVGHPNYIDDELFIFNMINQLNLGSVIYRPHPISRKNKKIKLFSNLSLDENILPSHKIAIVKESTLGCELQSLGVKIYEWHEKDSLIENLKKDFL